MSVNLPISIDKRTGFTDEIVIIGPDYSAAAFKIDIRNQKGDTGTALIALVTADSGSQGISATYDAAYVFDNNGTEETAPASIITIQIDEATIEALDLGNPAREVVDLVYDLHITPSVGLKFVQCGGSFKIDPGSTI